MGSSEFPQADVSEWSVCHHDPIILAVVKVIFLERRQLRLWAPSGRQRLARKVSRLDRLVIDRAHLRMLASDRLGRESVFVGIIGCSRL